MLGGGGAPPGVIPLNLGVLTRASRNMWLFVYWSYRSGGLWVPTKCFQVMIAEKS